MALVAGACQTTNEESELLPLETGLGTNFS